MADEEFSIGLVVTGEDKAAKAFENLKLKQMEAAAEAAKLGAELRKLQQSGTATAAEIETASRALIRAKQSASDFGAQATRVQRAMQAQAQTARQTTAATQAQSASVTSLGSKWGQLGSALGNVGSVAGHLSPRLGAIGGIIGQVGGATTALTGALGPVGVAIAAVTTVVGIAIPIIDSFSSELEDNETAARDAADEVTRYASAVEEANRQSQLRAGIGVASEDVEAEIARLERARRGMEQTRAGAVERLEAQGFGTSDTAISRTAHFTREGRGRTSEDAVAAEEATQSIRALDAQLAELRSGLETAREVEATASALVTTQTETETDAAERREGAADRAAAAERNRGRAATAAGRDRQQAEREAEAAAEANRNRAKEAENSAFLVREQQMAEQARQFRELHAFFDELDQASIEAQLSRAEELASKREQIAEQEKANAREKAEAVLAHQREIGAITTGMWDSIGGTVQDAAGQMFKFLISGAEGGEDAFLALLDSFLESTSIEYSIKALGEVANAVAAAARQDYPAAAQHAVAAALAAGVAAATGLASAAISVPSAGGGGGGPAQVGTGAPEGGGVTNVTVQIYSPNAVHTEAERGELVARSFREAERMRPGSART